MSDSPHAPPSPYAAPVGPAARVGRNDLCPCGSGQKYKRCHGAAADAAPVSEVAKIGPQWFFRHVDALLSGAAGDALARQAQVFDHDESLAAAASPTKSKRDRDLLERLKLSLKQSVLEPHEVIAVRRGYGVSLRGALTGRTFYVELPEVAAELEPLQWVVGRVVVFARRAYLLDGWQVVPFKRRKALRAALLSAYQSVPVTAREAEDEARAAAAAAAAEAATAAELAAEEVRLEGDEGAGGGAAGGEASEAASATASAAASVAAEVAAEQRAAPARPAAQRATLIPAAWFKSRAAWLAAATREALAGEVAPQ